LASKRDNCQSWGLTGKRKRKKQKRKQLAAFLSERRGGCAWLVRRGKKNLKKEKRGNAGAK